MGKFLFYLIVIIAPSNAISYQGFHIVFEKKRNLRHRRIGDIECFEQNEIRLFNLNQ